MGKEPVIACRDPKHSQEVESQAEADPFSLKWDEKDSEATEVDDPKRKIF